MSKKIVLPDWTQHQFDIALALPHLAGNESLYVQDCLQENWITSAGKYIGLFEEKVAQFTQSPYAVSVSSGTAGLHLALLSVGVEPNDLVILPNLSFVASANAIAYARAEALFIDIDAHTWQLDEDLLADFLEKKCFLANGQCYLTETKQRIAALMLVHALGNVGNMRALLALAKKYFLKVVEDAAESLGTAYENQATGTFGDVGVLSFNGNKIVTTGGGGMLLTSQAELANKIRHLANQAKTSTHLYMHDEVGYNYRMLNILAAIGVAQMEQLPVFLERKKEIDAFYKENFSYATFQKVLPEVKPNFWLFTALFESSERIQMKLEDFRIQTRKLWYPLSRLPMYAGCKYIHSQDVTWQVYQKSVSFPSGVGIEREKLEKIAEIMKYLSVPALYDKSQPYNKPS